MQSILGLLFLRVGIGFVFCLFGFDKFSHSANWAVYIPSDFFGMISKITGMTVQNILRFQGALELLIGIHLVSGFNARIAAGAAVVLLGLIVYFLDWDHPAIRDIGLLGASLAILCLGAGDWSIDGLLKNLPKENENKSSGGANL
jgi:uncharacterized membrane protein YphA (DoxX/SURF4 family)